MLPPSAAQEGQAPALEIMRNPITLPPQPAAPPPPPAVEPPPPPPGAPGGPLEIELDFGPAAAADPSLAAPAEVSAPAAPSVAAQDLEVPAVETDAPEEQILKAAIFYSPGADLTVKKFLGSLTDIARKKAKKPIYVRTVLAQASEVSVENVTEWIWTTKSAGAECFFVILPPEMLPDFMESTIADARQAGLHCFLVPQGEIVSRLLYVDLMVELMLIKRKK